MGLLEELFAAGVYTAGAIGMFKFVDQIRLEINKRDELGLKLTAVEKAEKDFVQAWDRMWKLRQAEKEYREMCKQAEDLAQRQNKFLEQYGKLLPPG